MTKLMNRNFVFTLLGLVCTSQLALAQSSGRSCLSSASNEQLVRELGLRLSVNPVHPVNPGHGAFDISITCKGSDLRVEVLDLAAGQIIKELSYNLYSDAKCQVAAASMMAKVPRIKLGGIIAFCKGSDLHRLFVSQEGSIMEKTENLYSDSKCLDAADSVNSNYPGKRTQ